jgi:phosphoribosylformylglycinamidine cyclo-ligase
VELLRIYQECLDNLRAEVFKKEIKTLPIFEFISKYVEEDEMYRTFNLGVGMILAVSEENVDYVLQNSDGYPIGVIKKGEKGVELK